MKRKIGAMFAVCFSGACAGGVAVPVETRLESETVSAELTASPAETAIRTVLQQQAEAWNDGDIPAFMEHYWRDDRLRFASGGNIARGWQATLDRYLRTYPDRSRMGTLTFSELEVETLATDAAIVHGRWQLVRSADKPSGLFTLVFRNVNSDWVITSDTTTYE